MGRASKQQAAANRTRVVETAARMFQEHGVAGVGIADLMAEAGLTHGGFYRQFASKDDVATEACALAMDRAVDHWRAIAARHPADDRLGALTAHYVAGNMARHRCPMPALAGDMAREPMDSPVRQAFTEGMRSLANVLTGDGDRDRAIRRLAAMVGAVTLARASSDPAFAAEILDAVRRMPGE